MVEDIVEEILFRARTSQIEWIEDALQIKLREKLKSWPSFLEVCERRNGYIHSDSKMTQRYIERVTSQSNKKSPTLSVGDSLVHNGTYFENAADALLEMSLLLVQKVARVLCADDASVIEELDKAFNSAIFDQNLRERYNSASRIAQLAEDGEVILKDLYSKMATVNYAVAQKQLGKSARSKRLIESVDWSSAMPEFQLCVAAVNDDFSGVCSLIPSMIGSGLVKPQSFFEWPVFQSARSEPEFWKVLADTYGDRLGDLPSDLINASKAVEEEPKDSA